MKKRVLSFNIKVFLYFFALKSDFETAIFSKKRFQGSPKYYKYLIYKYYLIFYVGEPWGNLWQIRGNPGGTLGEPLFMVSKGSPRIKSLISHDNPRLGEPWNL